MHTDVSRRELARGTLDLAILAVLAERPRYGYELMAVLEEATDGVLQVKEGSLYPVLHRLEDAGHVTSAWEAEGRAAPRKYYRITKPGRARLETLRTEWQRLAHGIARLLDGQGSGKGGDR